MKDFLVGSDLNQKRSAYDDVKLLTCVGRKLDGLTLKLFRILIFDPVRLCDLVLELGSQVLDVLVLIDLVVVQVNPNNLRSTTLERYPVVLGLRSTHVVIGATYEEVILGRGTNLGIYILTVGYFLCESRQTERCGSSEKK
jgi:hypothetical protein